MPKESETSQKMIAAVKAGDKLVRDVKKDVAQLVIATRELGGVFKSFLGKDKNEGDKGRV